MELHSIANHSPTIVIIFYDFSQISKPNKNPIVYRLKTNESRMKPMMNKTSCYHIILYTDFRPSHNCIDIFNTIFFLVLFCFSMFEL